MGAMSQLAMDQDTAVRITRGIVTNALHDIWYTVNAIGGFPSNEYERGSNDTVRQVLNIIEAKQAEVDHGS